MRWQDYLGERLLRLAESGEPTAQRLTEREALVLRFRMEGLTLDEIAAHMQISRQRVREIRGSALRMISLAGDMPHYRRPVPVGRGPIPSNSPESFYLDERFESS